MGCQVKVALGLCHFGQRDVSVIPVPETGVPMLLRAVLHYQTLLHLACFNQLYKPPISILRVLQVHAYVDILQDHNSPPFWFVGSLRHVGGFVPSFFGNPTVGKQRTNTRKLLSKMSRILSSLCRFFLFSAISLMLK